MQRRSLSSQALVGVFPKVASGRSTERRRATVVASSKSAARTAKDRRVVIEWAGTFAASLTFTASGEVVLLD